MEASLTELKDRTTDLTARVASEIPAITAAGVSCTGPAAPAVGIAVTTVKQALSGIKSEGQGLAGTYNKITSAIDKLQLDTLGPKIPSVASLFSTVKGVLSVAKPLIKLTGASVG